MLRNGQTSGSRTRLYHDPVCLAAPFRPGGRTDLGRQAGSLPRGLSFSEILDIGHRATKRPVTRDSPAQAYAAVSDLSDDL
jgi:hypothetical protein